MKKALILIGIISISILKAQLYTPNNSVGATTNASTNNVGIGTYNPNTTLEVASIPDGGKLTISTGGANGNSTTPKNPSLDFAGYLNGLKARITTTEETGNTHGSKFSIWVNDGTGASNLVERFKILQNGNIGIGITAPTSKLDINGDISQINGWIINGASNKSSGLTLANSSVRIDGYNGIVFSSSATQIGLQTERMRILQNGNVGIGTSSPTSKLDVIGKSSFSDNMKVDAKIEAKEVKVTTTPTADFVFAEDYNLPKLEEVEKFVTEKKHLPEVASAKEMEKEGVNIGEFQIKLLQKIEELTLYSIEQNKQLKSQNEKILELEKQVQELKSKK